MAAEILANKKTWKSFMREWSEGKNEAAEDRTVMAAGMIRNRGMRSAPIRSVSDYLESYHLMVHVVYWEVTAFSQ